MNSYLIPVDLFISHQSQPREVFCSTALVSICTSGFALLSSGTVSLVLVKCPAKTREFTSFFIFSVILVVLIVADTDSCNLLLQGRTRDWLGLLLPF